MSLPNRRVALKQSALGFGYLAWGEPRRRAEAEFVDSLGAVLGEVREQNRLMQQVLAEGERKAHASLAVCEKAQVKLQTELEQCLFAKAADAPAVDAGGGHPRSGHAPVDETVTYPVPVPAQ